MLCNCGVHGGGQTEDGKSVRLEAPSRARVPLQHAIPSLVRVRNRCMSEGSDKMQAARLCNLNPNHSLPAVISI